MLSLIKLVISGCFIFPVFTFLEKSPLQRRCSKKRKEEEEEATERTFKKNSRVVTQKVNKLQSGGELKRSSEILNPKLKIKGTTIITRKIKG